MRGIVSICSSRPQEGEEGEQFVLARIQNAALPGGTTIGRQPAAEASNGDYGAKHVQQLHVYIPETAVSRQRI